MMGHVETCAAYSLLQIEKSHDKRKIVKLFSDGTPNERGCHCSVCRKRGKHSKRNVQQLYMFVELHSHLFLLLDSLDARQRICAGGMHVLLFLRHGHAKILLHGVRQGPIGADGDGRATPLYQGLKLDVYFRFFGRKNATTLSIVTVGLFVTCCRKLYVSVGVVGLSAGLILATCENHAKFPVRIQLCAAFYALTLQRLRTLLTSGLF